MHQLKLHNGLVLTKHTLLRHIDTLSHAHNMSATHGKQQTTTTRNKDRKRQPTLGVMVNETLTFSFLPGGTVRAAKTASPLTTAFCSAAVSTLVITTPALSSDSELAVLSDRGRSETAPAEKDIRRTSPDRRRLLCSVAYNSFLLSGRSTSMVPATEPQC